MKAVAAPMLDLPQEALKLLAAMTMFIDHMGLTLFPHARWLRCVGRLAFPIYTFFLTEGFRHTRSRGRYLLRLVGFALVSEIPFNLMVTSACFSLRYQNVLWTLALGLLAMGCLDLARQARGWKGLLSLLGAPACCVLAEILRMDYGAFGVLLCMVFYVTRRVPLRAVVRCVVFLLMCYGFYYFPGAGVPLEVFGVISIPLLELYHGRKASGNAVAKYGFYAFYPVHMLILSLL